MTPEEKMFDAAFNHNHDYFKNLPQGVDLNAQNEYGNTLLHVLAYTQFVPNGIANVLKRYPDPFIENQSGMTPRMLAEWHKHTSQAAFLAAYEASYAEKQRRFQVECQSDAIERLADMIHCNETVWTRDEIYNIADRMRRGAHGRAE